MEEFLFAFAFLEMKILFLLDGDVWLSDLKEKFIEFKYTRITVDSTFLRPFLDGILTESTHGQATNPLTEF